MRLCCLWRSLIFSFCREPNHEDPPIEPTKLFRVQRIKPIKGTPYWEQRILRDLGIDKRVSR